MTTNTNRIYGWCAIAFLLAISVYCLHEIGNSWSNAIINVAVTFLAFYIGYKDAKMDCSLLQNKIEELQQRIKQIEDKLK